MSYKMQADVNYELCFGCEFDADGTRIQATNSDGAEAGKVVAGSTCGGYPNGWCVARQLDYFITRYDSPFTSVDAIFN